jgi:hypothetical protein
MRVAVTRTPEERRAYIATARRSQPIDELYRKAMKAHGLRSQYRPLRGMEGTDYTFARSWRRDLKDKPHRVELFRLTFCSLCHSFAPVGEPVKHKTRCSANPLDDGPYPGWHASGVYYDQAADIGLSSGGVPCL